MSAMEEAIHEFTSECEEMLERISLSLSKLEKEGPDKDTLSSIYRDMHTIKGSSQLFGFSQIGHVAHAMESSLDPLRQGVTPLNLNLIDIIYRGCDLIGRLIVAIKETQAEHDAYAELKEIVPMLIDLTVSSMGGSPRTIRDDFVGFDINLLRKEDQVADIPSNHYNSEENFVVDQVNEENKTVPKAEVSSKKPLQPVTSLTENEKIDEEVPKTPLKMAKPEPVSIPTPKPQVEKKAAQPTSHRPNVAQTKPDKPAFKENTALTEQKGEGASKANKSDVSQETIRVQVSLLDKLMNLAGELVLVRNQVLRFASEQKNTEFSKLSQRINLVTTEIQNEVMKTRMQPVGSVLSKFHRVVRDLAKELNKKIELKLEGTETELDKTLIEAVKDPLTHIVRNSADHGLESPEEREASGKNALGTISIKSYHEGGQVVIEINDNGRGLDRNKIGTKAVEKKVVSHDQLRLMTDKEVYQLIFAPGFSTATSVSNISGRGVGMDVVKTNIERIGGIIDLNAIPGEGTSIYLKIPLTLAIVPALLVRENESKFAIPQVKLLELLRVNQGEENKENRIEILQGKPVYRLRGQLLPLVSLGQIAGFEKDSMECVNKASCNIVILKAGTAVFGLIVDEIEDSADIVVKPLTTFMKALGIYSGATLLGDGTVALTLDVMGIAEKAMINLGEEEVDYSAVARENQEYLDSITDYLVVDIGDQSKYCFPLPTVNRLEEFKPSDYDYSGDQKVVRYRGSLLPIISATDFFGHKPKEKLDASEAESVVVIQRHNRLFGLKVETILDVISSRSKIDNQINARTGIMGSMIEKDEVLVVIDAMRLIDHHCFNHNIKMDTGDGRSSDSLTHILVVEDSRFFRNHVKAMLEANGFEVTTAENGEEALDKLMEKKDKISLVISDIEMPKMDGLTFARHVAQDAELCKIPMIAVTTRFRQADIEKGLEIGFKKYLEKLNEEQLLATIKEFIGG